MIRGILIGLLAGSILCNAILLVSNELRPCSDYSEDIYRMTKRGCIAIFIASGALGLLLFY